MTKQLREKIGKVNNRTIYKYINTVLLQKQIQKAQKNDKKAYDKRRKENRDIFVKKLKYLYQRRKKKHGTISSI